MSLLDAVVDVVKLAGAEAKSHFATALDIETKADGSPVTLADRQAERIARAWIEARFPDDGIVGEELGVARPDAKRRWLLDPIDGTKAFVRGVPLWGTMVAVAEGDEVLASAIFYPALGELIAAERGRGCFWNDAPCRVSTVSSLAAATVLATDLGHIPSGLTRLASRAAVARTWGDCYGYLLVATGRAEAMIDPVLSAWDSAPLQPLIEEAGGVFTSFDGRRTAFGGSAVATNATLAREVRALLTPEAAAQTPLPSLDLDTLDFSKGQGLVTVATQDARTGELLMVAHADREALERTLATGEMHYRSRTRGLWHKGGTSGNVQRVVSLSADCDGDAILARVLPAGPACHTGEPTCFRGAGADALTELDHTLAERAASPLHNSYTTALLTDKNRRLKKLGEETTELVVALCEGDLQGATEEAADVVYHVLVALRAAGLSLDDVREVLAQRARGPRRG
jgi:histidinol phosphatase-like enzyme (inositol monophosphatase family)